MRSENLLIVAGHAWQCLDCQTKLLADPVKAVISHRLMEEEQQALSKLSRADFATVTSLAQALHLDRRALDEIMNNPRCRLRHL